MERINIMMEQEQEASDAGKGASDLHHQYYLVPYTDSKAVDANVAALMSEYPMRFHPVNSMSEMFMLLNKSDLKIDSIALDAELLYESDRAGMLDIINTLHTIITCSKFRDDGDQLQDRDTAILITVGHRTNLQMLRELMRVPHVTVLCVRGGDASLDDVRRSVEHLLRKEHYVSDTVKQMAKPKKSKRTNRDGIVLTSRQQQIYDLLRSKGSSNKQIARMLDLSESTVKLHIGQILKKFGCTNRTQLALTVLKDK